MAAGLTARRLTLVALGALLVLLGVRAAGAEAGTLLHLLLALLPVLLLAAYPLLVLAGLLRDRLLVLLALAAVAGHLLVVAPALQRAPVPAGADTAPRLRVVVANAYVANPEPERLGRLLRGLRADVVVLPELTPATLAGLRRAGLTRDLPHVALERAGRQETVGLLSRLPLRDREVRRTGTRAVVRATVEVGGVAVRVVPVHPLPPIGGWEPLWRDALVDLASDLARDVAVGPVRDRVPAPGSDPSGDPAPGRAAGTDLPLVLAGDLNADRDAAAFRRLLDAGLVDAADALGQGLTRTYPAGAPLVHLDHVLVRDGRRARLVPLRHALVPLPGSDHLGVVVDVAVLPR